MKIEKTLIQKTHEKEGLEKELKYKEEERLYLQKRMKIINQAQGYLQSKAEQIQNKTKIRIEGIVQETLNTCFPGQFKFDLSFIPKRGKTEIELALIENGERINPLHEGGGALIDVISFGLRMAVLSIRMHDSHLPIEGVLFLDEPFKFLDKEKRNLIAKLLKELCEKIGLQIFLITHENEIAETADKLFTVEKKGKVSVVSVE